MPRRCPLNSRCPLFRASVKGGSTVCIYVVSVIVHVTCAQKFLHNYIDALNVPLVCPHEPPSCIYIYTERLCSI